VRRAGSGRRLVLSSTLSYSDFDFSYSDSPALLQLNLKSHLNFLFITIA
jgi:hypothetical protein